MKTKNKVLLIVATVFIILGGLIFTFSLALNNWDIGALSTEKLESHSYEIYDDFENIFIDIDTADIKFLPSPNEYTQILLREHKNEPHMAAVSDNTLKISVNDQRHWTDYIGISFESTKITVYLPKAEYSSLEIDTSTGNIDIPDDFKFQDIDIKGSTTDVNLFASAEKDIKITLSTGDINAESINCGGDIITKVSTGKTHLTDINCKNLKSCADTGDIYINSCDAAEIEITTDTGDIKGTLKTPKIFIAKTDTGKIQVPETTEGGRCKLTTDTGDIIISVE